VLRFRLLGIPVRVEPLHWVILALLGGAIYINSREDLIQVLLFMAAGFVSILIHEFGHALTGRRFGARPEVVMHGLGGVAIFPSARFTRAQHLLVTGAGPAVQLVLGVLAWSLWKYALPEAPVSSLFLYLWIVSFFWALLNLVPVYPLDGGQIMYQLLGQRRHVLAMKISMITAIAVGLTLFLTTRSFLFPILLGFMAYQNYQLLRPRWK
jgi:membrane-associated protease RseP (regulator of RpoE activity)